MSPRLAAKKAPWLVEDGEENEASYPSVFSEPQQLNLFEFFWKWCRVMDFLRDLALD